MFFSSSIHDITNPNLILLKLTTSSHVIKYEHEGKIHVDTKKLILNGLKTNIKFVSVTYYNG